MDVKKLFLVSLCAVIFSIIWFYITVNIATSLPIQGELWVLYALILIFFIISDLLGSIVLYKLIIDKKEHDEKNPISFLVKLWIVTTIIFLVVLVLLFLVVQTQIKSCESRYDLLNAGAARSPPSPYLCYKWISDIMVITILAAFFGPHNLISIVASRHMINKLKHT